MDLTVYEFNNIKCDTEAGYIFQTVKDRKLSDIYHSHDFYEWIVILEGNCTQIINETQVHAPKNTCILLCPGDRHKFINQSEDINVISLSVKKEEINRFAVAFDLDEITAFRTVLNAHQVSTLLNFYHAGNQCEYKLLLANLIAIFTDSFGENKDIPYALKSAVKEMAKPENLRHGIERFTRLSGFSRSHLNRLMKKYYSTTLHDFIVNTRLEAAYNAFILTNANAEDLADSLGYTSFSHFNKIFKEKYKITPAALRKKHGSWTA